MNVFSAPLLLVFLALSNEPGESGTGQTQGAGNAAEPEEPGMPPVISGEPATPEPAEASKRPAYEETQAPGADGKR